jgi:hypothetical protein
VIYISQILIRNVPGKPEEKSTASASVAFFFLYMLIFGGSVNCIPWVYGPEVLRECSCVGLLRYMHSADSDILALHVRAKGCVHIPIYQYTCNIKTVQGRIPNSK